MVQTTGRGSFTLDEFKTFFRVGKISVQCLEDLIARVCSEENVSGILDRKSTGGVPQTTLHKRVLIMLWYMASKDKYESLADRFGVSTSTVCCSIRPLLQFISDYLLDKIIVWPSQEECQEMSEI